MLVNFENGIVTIKWQHWRNHKDDITLDPFSGTTKCIVRTPTNEICAETVCSKQDRYDKERGRRISLTRALQYKILQLTKKDRAKIWKQYLEKRR